MGRTRLHLPACEEHRRSKRLRHPENIADPDDPGRFWGRGLWEWPSATKNKSPREGTLQLRSRPGASRESTVQIWTSSTIRLASALRWLESLWCQSPGPQ